MITAWLCAALLLVSVLSWKRVGASGRPVHVRSQRTEPRQASEQPSEELAVTYDVAQQVISTLASLMRSGAHHRYAWEALTSALAVENQAVQKPARNASSRVRSHELESWRNAASLTTSRVALGAPVTMAAAPYAGCEPDRFPRMLRDVYWAQGLAEKTGIAYADLLEAVAAHAKARATAIRSQVTGIAAAQTTRRILALLPLGGIVMAQLLGADPLGILFTTIAGRVCLFAGCLLWCASLIWSRRLISKMSRGDSEVAR